jgi:hypothetical protein
VTIWAWLIPAGVSALILIAGLFIVFVKLRDDGTDEEDQCVVGYIFVILFVCPWLAYFLIV